MRDSVKYIYYMNITTLIVFISTILDYFCNKLQIHFNHLCQDWEQLVADNYYLKPISYYIL